MEKSEIMGKEKMRKPFFAPMKFGNGGKIEGNGRRVGEIRSARSRDKGWEGGVHENLTSGYAGGVRGRQRGIRIASKGKERGGQGWSAGVSMQERR